jgi:hypothetical protein
MRRIITIENTDLYNKFKFLYPEYYYRKVPKEYFEQIRKIWKTALKESGITYNPVFYHYHKDKSRIELEDEDNQIMYITQSTWKSEDFSLGKE